MKQLIYSSKALKVLDKIPTNTAKLIRSKVKQYVSDPASLANNVKALKGRSKVFRLRVGDWRVIFTEDGYIVEITDVAPRGSAYD